MFAKSFGKTAVSMLAATLCATLLMSGCSDDDGDGGSSRDVPPNPQIGLVLPDGQAWTNTNAASVGNRIGVIFSANGRFTRLYEHAGIWAIYDEGTYTSTSRSITATVDGERMTIDYAIIGNRLVTDSEFGDFWITSNVRIGGSSNNSNVVDVVTYYCPNSCTEVTSTSMPSGCFTSQSACRDAVGGGVTPGGSFTNGARDIWFGGCEEVTPAVEMCYGIAFRNGRVFDYMQVSGMGNTWYEMEIGTYTTSGNRIIFEEDFYLTYSVSGNTLRLDGIDYYIDTDTFTRRGNLTFISTPEDGLDECDLFPDWCDDDEGGGGEPVVNLDSRLILPDGRAWVDDWDVGERDGFIFNANGTVQLISDYDGYWAVDATGTWSTSGNRLTITVYGFTETGIYTVSGNTLILDGDYFLTNTAVTIGGGGDGGTDTEPATFIRFNWDVNEEYSDFGGLDWVVADYENVEYVYDFIYEYFDDVCGEYPDENYWMETDCWYLISEFPRYPGISGNFPIVFDYYESQDSRRNEFLEIDNTANDLLVVGVAEFTAMAMIYHEEWDDHSFIVANYEINPATGRDEVVDYTLIFDIELWHYDDCDNSPEGQCIYFGEGEEMDDWLFKSKPRRPNMIRRIPGTRKVADGLEVSYWVIRTSKTDRDRFRPLRRAESQAQPQPEQSQPRSKFMQRESDSGEIVRRNRNFNRRSPFRSQLRRATSAQ